MTTAFPLAAHAADPLGAVGTSAAPTTLSARLAERDDARRAFDLARELFIAGRRVDMGTLASDVGVDRTSLFRWVGNRDALLSEVLWSLAVPTLVKADHAHSDDSGAERLIGTLSRFVDDLISATYFRAFLQREPARAMRLLTTNAGPVHARYVATTEWLVRRDLGDEPLAGAIDPAALAYLLVRISESFTYSDLIAGAAPSADQARAAFRLVLRTGAVA